MYYAISKLTLFDDLNASKAFFVDSVAYTSTNLFSIDAVNECCEVKVELILSLNTKPGQLNES